MKRKLKWVSFLLSVYVCAYLILEWFHPVGSLALLVSAVVLAPAGWLCAWVNVKTDRSRSAVLAVMVGGIGTLLIELVFLTMWVMGQGA